MLPKSSDPAPPGQQRPYPEPDKTGKIPFQVPGYEEKGDTVYKLWGDLSSDKVPLICLHGGPGAAHNYILPICLIYKDYGIPVVMYDQIGCGLSTHFPHRLHDTKFWTSDMFIAELENLKHALGIKTFDLLGQSWGGMLGAYYTGSRQPEGLRKLIIADSPSDMVLWLQDLSILRKELPQDVQDTLTRCEREKATDSPEYKAAVNVFNHRFLCRLDPFPKELQATIDQQEKDPTVYLTMNGPSEFHVIGSLAKWNVRPLLKNITTKTVPGGILLINGYHDEVQDTVMTPYFLEPQAKVKWIRYALSAHCAQLEETEKYMVDLAAFLQH